MTVRRRRPRDAGMGNWGAAVTGLIASRELGQLNSAVHTLLDKVISAIGQRAGLLEGYLEARTKLDEAQRKFGPITISTGFMSAPNAVLIPFVTAFATAKKGVQVMAREVQTLGFLDRVFTQISAALTQAGLANDANSIDQALIQIRRFNLDTDNAFFSKAPEYNAAKQAILAQASAEWKALGVSSSAYDDPKWFAGYLRAAQKVVPIENPPAPPSEIQAAGLGALPVLGALLIWVIGIVVAGFVLASAIGRIVPDQNGKARTAEKLLLAYQEQKAKEAAEMRAMGKSEAEIQDRMNAIDQEAKKAVEHVPDPPSMLKWVLIPVGVIGAGYVVGKMTGWL